MTVATLHAAVTVGILLPGQTANGHLANDAMMRQSTDGMPSPFRGAGGTPPRGRNTAWNRTYLRMILIIF
jgi:hypothetical protein